MKKIMILGAVLAVASGCTRVVEVEVPTHTTQDVTQQTQPSYGTSRYDGYPQSTYELFIFSVHEISSYEILIRDKDLWDAGIGVCAALAAGATAEDFAMMAYETVGTDEMSINIFSSIVAAAVTVICSEFEYRFQSAGI